MISTETMRAARQVPLIEISDDELARNVAAQYDRWVESDLELKQSATSEAEERRKLDALLAEFMRRSRGNPSEPSLLRSVS